METKKTEEIQKLPYKIYVEERRALIKHEQAKYDSYEKTVLTLCAAFLAFSVSFAGLLKRKLESGGEAIILASPNMLVWSWTAFVSAMVFILIGFFASARLYEKEIDKISKAVDNINALDEKNNWQTLEYILYALSSTAFVLGVVFLLIFCATNVRIL